MKHASKLLAAFSLLSVAALPSQADTAYTDPVMAASTTLGEGYSVLGITALNPIEATGVIDSIASTYVEGEYTFTVLNVSNVPSDWSTNDYSNQGGVVEYNFRDVPLYYVEITSGDKEGQILDVVATVSGATSTLTVGGDLSGLDSELTNATFSIRQKHTVASVFGENNEAGLLSGQNDTDSDLLYVFYDKVFERVYYQTDSVGMFGTGWRLVGAPFEDVSSICIDPDYGIMFFKRNAGELNVVTVGDVKLGTARTLITQGYNPIVMKFPVDFTLATSGLYVEGNAVLDGGQNDTESDVVFVMENGIFERYYYQIDSVGMFGSGWRKVGAPFVDASTTALEAGMPILVYRRSSEPVEWSLDQPFSVN